MSETTTPSAIEVHLPEPPLTKFERERRAFYRLLPEQLNTHRGQYVAIHDEHLSCSVRIWTRCTCSNDWLGHGSPQRQRLLHDLAGLGPAQLELDHLPFLQPKNAAGTQCGSAACRGQFAGPQGSEPFLARFGLFVGHEEFDTEFRVMLRQLGRRVEKGLATDPFRNRPRNSKENQGPGSFAGSGQHGRIRPQSNDQGFTCIGHGWLHSQVRARSQHGVDDPQDCNCRQNQQHDQRS